MPRGISRINNYYNRIEAWNDWNRFAAQATADGHGELVERHQPATDAGWRKIDKAIGALRDAIAAQAK